MSALPSRPLLALAFSLVSSTSAFAQCGSWRTDFGTNGPDVAPRSWVVHDDGSGPALYGAGFTEHIGVEALRGVVRFDGSAWTQVGTGLSNVTGITAFDDGSGRALYACGAFGASTGSAVNAVARWDGMAWVAPAGPGPIGADDSCAELAVLDLGAGARLIGIGSITLAGSATRTRVFRRDAVAWTALDAGLPAGRVDDVDVLDDGSGPALVVSLVSAGASNGVYRASGAGWVRLGPAISSVALPIAVLDLGGVQSLYLGTGPASIGGVFVNGLARWTGTQWTSVGVFPSGVNPLVACDLALHDDGSGPALILAASFLSTTPPFGARLMRWNGATWTAPYGDFEGRGSTSGATIDSLASVDFGGIPRLITGGSFGRVAGVAAHNLALRSNGAWSATAVGAAPSDSIASLCVHDDGSGPALIAGGTFVAAGASSARFLARWDGAAWSALGAGGGPNGAVSVVESLDFVGARSLYAGGTFTSMDGVPAQGIARWNGTSWNALGAGIHGRVRAIVVHDDGNGPSIYVGGSFDLAGGAPASNVARWDGASWHALGSGVVGEVFALEVHARAGTPELYVGGVFQNAGGISVNGLARWSSGGWSAIAGVPANFVTDLAVFDVGNGPELHAACGDVLARWDGASWTSVLAPPNRIVGSLHVVSTPSARRLLVSLLDTQPMLVPDQLAELDASGSWTTVATFERGEPTSVAVFDDGSDRVPDLYVGGGFETVESTRSVNLARFDFCGTPASIECPGDGSGAACPCGNSGAPDHGCANSVHGSGAALRVEGLASLGYDSLTLLGESLSGTSAIALQSDALSSPAPFGDGLLCVGGTARRLGTASVAAGGLAFPSSGAGLAARGGITHPGTLVHYHLVYRNAASFCTSGTMNVSNALHVVWTN